jgi:hypothetical protein
VSEQHLDLLAQSPRCPSLPRFGKRLPARRPRRRSQKAIEWHLIERFTDVTISDGINDYTIAEFSLAMALNDVSTTLARER